MVRSYSQHNHAADVSDSSSPSAPPTPLLAPLLARQATTLEAGIFNITYDAPGSNCSVNPQIVAFVFKIESNGTLRYLVQVTMLLGGLSYSYR